MVGMSTTFDQQGKENGPSNTGSGRKGAAKSFGYNQNNPQQLQNPIPPQPDVRPANMPDTYMSGYYPNTNSAYSFSFPNFNQQPAWSTGTNVNSQPQGYDHNVANYGFGALPPGGASENQYMGPDHLFNPSNSGFANTFAGTYLNGTGWSYFNNANPFYFPTGNAELNLQFSTADNPNGPLHQDLYKVPPPQEHEKAKVESDELSAFENGEDPESVGKALSQLSVSGNQGDMKDDNDPTVSSTVPVSTKGSKNSLSNSSQSGTSNAPAKPTSWAAVASQPAKPKPPQAKGQKGPVQLPSVTKSNYSGQNGTSGKNGSGKQQGGSNARWNRQNADSNGQSDGASESVMSKDSSPLLRKLWAENNFNPKEMNLDFKGARFFIIKSYSEDDIFRSIKYSIWTSTEHGNRRLNEAFRDQQKNGGTPIYMLFSVNSSGHFCGIAQMMSHVDIHVETGVWVQDKWKGKFSVKWIYVKDVPNSALRHIRLENNEYKPITNSRDTQEVPPEKGKLVVKIMHSYKAQTSIFDDFSHYEQRQEEDARIRGKKMP